MKLTDLVARGHRVVVVDFGDGDTLAITRKNYTEALWSEVQAVEAREGEGFLALRARRLLPFIADWDVVDAKGTKVAPSEEIICQLDSSVIGAIDEALGRDLLPPKTASVSSDAGSQQAGS